MYSVVASGVARRTPEFGIRMALGARTVDLVRLVVGVGVRYAVAGVALRSAVALAVAPKIASLLFGVSPREPATFALVALPLVVIAVVASVVPAWRATRIDPAAALKTD